jgi:cysteine desulfurase
VNPRIYLDHAATTPVRDDVLAAMLPHFTANGYNASSLHAEGRAARAALDRSRDSVAALLGAKPREIVFTGGGSEADNLAIFGVARALRERGRHLITTATEHHAVLHAFDVLEDDGFEVARLPVDSDGRVAPESFARALRPDTIFASVMLANNELGTLQPIAELAALAHERGAIFHTDAVQAPGRIALDVRVLGVDLLSLSAHKFYGPKGVGALYVRSGTSIAPLVVGGGQEAALRAGTENVAGIVGLARAFELAAAELRDEAPRLAALRDRFERELLAAEPSARVNASTAPRLPNVASIAFPDVDAPTLLARLDLEGVAVSAGSACAAGSSEPSHVLAALDVPAWVRGGTIRFSLGRSTSEQDVERLVRMLPDILRSVRVDGPNLGTARHGASQTDRSEVRF